MASSIWVAGPTEIWVGVGAGASLAFLGWATPEGVHGRIEAYGEPARSDIAGPRMPHDVQFFGETISATCELAVWDDAVLRACQTRANPFGGVAGRMPAGSIGGLLRTEGAAYRTLLYPPYPVLKPSQAGQTVYNILAGWLKGPDQFNLGTRQKLMRIFIEGIPVYNPADGSWTTYDSNVAGKGIAA